MWLYRGAQSAVFYYVTCTPCAEAAYRRKRRREAVRSKREQAQCQELVTDQPTIFPQPTPFSTNEGWSDEIALGPGPPARRGHRNQRSANRIDETMQLPRLSATSSVAFSDDISHKKDKSGLMSPLGDRWHFMRYQREDERLWGDEAKGSSIGIFGRGRAEDASNPRRYYIAKVPPVNDLHPPIVSVPTSRAETRWMLQPPPSARAMAGKVSSEESAAASRSGSVRKKSDWSRTTGKAENDVLVDDEIQLGSSSPLSERKSRLSQGRKGALPDQKSFEKRHRRPEPISLSERPRSDYNLSNTLASLDRAPVTRPSVALLDRSKSSPQVAYAYDEFRIRVTPTAISGFPSASSLSSAEDSIMCPGTPYSRPESKSTEDSGKAFRSSSSNVLTPLSSHKAIEAVHLEFDERKHQPGQQSDRPWRWSFDI
jgi:hypothetical protein